jgi:hypothetical protein
LAVDDDVFPADGVLDEEELEPPPPQAVATRPAAITKAAVRTAIRMTVSFPA